MEGSVGAQLFWMVALGLSVGYASYYIYGKEGIDFVPSILVGLAGSLVVGITALILKVSMALSGSLIGSLAFIFVVNVFRQKTRPVFADTSNMEEDQS